MIVILMMALVFVPIVIAHAAVMWPAAAGTQQLAGIVQRPAEDLLTTRPGAPARARFSFHLQALDIVDEVVDAALDRCLVALRTTQVLRPASALNHTPHTGISRSPWPGTRLAPVDQLGQPVARELAVALGQRRQVRRLASRGRRPWGRCPCRLSPWQLAQYMLKSCSPETPALGSASSCGMERAADSSRSAAAGRNAQGSPCDHVRATLCTARCRSTFRSHRRVARRSELVRWIGQGR